MADITTAITTVEPVELMDADEWHKLHPTTFWMPPMEERQALPEGTHVKLVFEGEPMAERMWVRIDWRSPERAYYGTLINAPVYNKNIDYGDEVFFEPRHIIDIDFDAASDVEVA